MTTLDEVIRASLGDEADGNIVNVGFMSIAVSKDAPRDMFIGWLKEQLAQENMYGVTAEALTKGMNYIQLGAWVGDQRQALILMALGAHHGVWHIMTPANIGITDLNESQKLMGQGFLYVVPSEEQLKKDGLL